ncbi:MAG: RES family NAD+ phosphorylase [SAR324 cluster bacterium]|nr:RES family NAD+ phosphorylase [SAR324 cluster bacterium]
MMSSATSPEPPPRPIATTNPTTIIKPAATAPMTRGCCQSGFFRARRDAALDAAEGTYQMIDYQRTQEIGAAVAFLECDGLIVPSARWNCENFVLFWDNQSMGNQLELLATEEIDWCEWARENGFLDAPKEK